MNTINIIYGAIFEMFWKIPLLQYFWMIWYSWLWKMTELSFCTSGWTPSRTDGTPCSYSSYPSKKWWFWEEWWDIWCSRMDFFFSCGYAADLVWCFIWIWYELYLLFVIGSDGWEGEGIETKAWLRQGEERQNPWRDESRGRWIQKAFRITVGLL